MKPAIPRLFLQAALAAAALIASGASAFNLLPMDELPVRYMTEEDRQIFRAAATRVLESSADGQASFWENAATGARGELTPRATFEREGRPCREIQIENSARGRSNRLVLTACRQEDGEWKVEQQ